MIAMAALNFRHLRYFHAIASAGSLSRAATLLNLSQSALSVQLGKLEAQLGHPLFDRVGRGLQLTEAGRIALDYADSVFKTGDELLSTLRGQPAAGRQMLRIGALTTLSRNFQLAFLQPMIGRDDVELIVRSGGLNDLLAQLESHDLDLVLSTRAPQRDGATTLCSHLLDEQPVSLVGRPADSSAPFAFPADLATMPVLLPSPDNEIRAAFDRIVAAAGITPNIAAEIDDMAMLRLMARSSRALTLVPPIVVRDELDAGTLVERCRVPGITERFYAIEQRRRFPNPLIAELLGSGGGSYYARVAFDL